LTAAAVLTIVRLSSGADHGSIFAEGTGRFAATRWSSARKISSIVTTTGQAVTTTTPLGGELCL
jgi:hypothetical protein